MAQTLKLSGDELETYRDQIEETLAGEYGHGYVRKVTFEVRYQTFNVYDHGALLLSTQVAAEAAAAFNGIRPRD